MIKLTRRAGAPGIELSCREAGQGGPRVMLLHGFPQAAFVWDPVLQALAGEACLLAPNLRGYEASSAPAEPRAYHARELVADLVALIEGLGAPLDLLVAHDWGGALAWNLAAQRPDLMRRLLVINAPHPAAFVRQLRQDAGQREASAYMNFLVRPDAEQLLAEQGFARLLRFLGSPWWVLDESERERYRMLWRQGLTGALNYYRASPIRPPDGDDDRLDRLQLSDESVTVTVPTTVLWGQQDHALRPGLLDALERWVPRLTVTPLAQASHWVLQEHPAQVIAAVRGLLAQEPG